MSQYNDPTLLEIAEGNAAPTYSGSLLVTLPTIGQWVYLIVETPIPLPHPIHLHGHDFFVLGSGTGTYSASSSLNLVNPPRRDTALLPGAGWMAVAFVTDNPGSWLAHCHIGWVSCFALLLRILF
jgi:FtsP/CotA-like multicopper oxidase with cupredoxin domain